MDNRRYQSIEVPVPVSKPDQFHSIGIMYLVTRTVYYVRTTRKMLEQYPDPESEPIAQILRSWQKGTDVRYRYGTTRLSVWPVYLSDTYRTYYYVHKGMDQDLHPDPHFPIDTRLEKVPLCTKIAH